NSVRRVFVTDSRTVSSGRDGEVQARYGWIRQCELIVRRRSDVESVRRELSQLAAVRPADNPNPDFGVFDDDRGGLVQGEVSHAHSLSGRLLHPIAVAGVDA